MPRRADAILKDIAVFQPVDKMWLPLEQLLEELFQHKPQQEWISILFGIFERFPREDGAGVFWSIVHGVESMGFDYEQELLDSMSCQYSDMGEVMLGRLKRS